MFSQYVHQVQTYDHSVDAADVGIKTAQLAKHTGTLGTRVHRLFPLRLVLR